MKVLCEEVSSCDEDIIRQLLLHHKVLYTFIYIFLNSTLKQGAGLICIFIESASMFGFFFLMKVKVSALLYIVLLFIGYQN